MAWFKVDDGFHGHPKVVELSLSAVGLWTVAGSWCAQYLTDGLIPDRIMRRLGGGDATAGELVDAGLWLPVDGAWQFKDWSDYQPMKEEVEAERAAARERMKKVRAGKKGVRSPERAPNVPRTAPERSDEVRIAPSRPTRPTRPDVPNGTSTPPTDVDAVFERAYKSWPKKTEKKKSAEKFKLLAKKHDPEWLAEQVVKFGRAYASTTEARYVPALVVWLNGERWTDDLPTASPTVINTQWDQLMNTPTDPCSIGHLWVRDGTCARCTARKDMT